MSSQSNAVADALARFPRSSNNSIARALYKDNPGLWISLNAARCAVRLARNGRPGRNEPAKFSASTWSAKDPFKDLPEGDRQIPNWTPYIINRPATIGIIGDIHSPYYSSMALQTSMEYFKERKVGVIVLNGDLIDFYQISKWDTDPQKRHLKEEIDILNDLLARMRSMFPKASIIYKAGNHEERYIRFMRVKAPELLGIEAFNLENILKLGKYRIKFVGNKRRIRAGGLNILHGHEYRFPIANPVNPARGLFLRAKTYALCHHFHQSSMHSENTLDGSTIATWSVGCCCELFPEYAPLNNWQHGCAIVDLEENGKFVVHNKTIKNGNIL